MASIINATTSNGLLISPDNSGQIQFQLNGVNVPSPSVAPAFSAYQSTAQTLSSVTVTKIQFQTKEFDTNNNFDNITNYRFTPTVAGYYYVSGSVSIASSATVILVYIYKNGSLFRIVTNSNTSSISTGSGSSLIYMNGSTDYLELYAYVVTGQSLAASPASTYFQAFLARTA